MRQKRSLPKFGYSWWNKSYSVRVTVIILLYEGMRKMVRVALIGLGKMGISHLAIANSHPDVRVVAVCDVNAYLASILNKYTGIRVSADYRQLLREGDVDAVIIATPPRLHGEMVKEALDRHLHVFCEKPFCLDIDQGARLAALAQDRGLVNQVGYHCRFLGSFKEARRLITSGMLGRIHHVRAEAYGPVVLRPSSGWRALRTEGGGCLHEYACHAIDLLVYLVGAPERVSGTVLNQIFSRDAEDEVYTTLYFENGLSGQLCSNWSDDSHRKLSVKVTIWGTNGRASVDRQEVQVFLRKAVSAESKLKEGWNILFNPTLTQEVWYYLRGEEYSAQFDHFIRCIERGERDTISSFASALVTDQVVSTMLEDRRAGTSMSTVRAVSRWRSVSQKRKGILRRVRALLG